MSGRRGDVLVIGYGNSLRGDDGVGPAVAAAVAARGWPGVTAVAVTQLTPELAERLATAAAVVFVDASLDATAGVAVRELTADPAAIPPTHSGDPCALLAWAVVLYGRAPRAWLVTVPGRDFSIRDGLSAAAADGARQALAVIQELLAGGRLSGTDLDLLRQPGSACFGEGRR